MFSEVMANGVKEEVWEALRFPSWVSHECPKCGFVTAISIEDRLTEDEYECKRCKRIISM